MRRVVLIVGPPGAGKSTLAESLVELRHLEREQFESGQQFRAAAGRLASDPTARACVVRCCETFAEQREWERLIGATETVVLDVPFKECARRIHRRGRRNWKGEVMAAQRWWASRRGGVPPAPRVREYAPSREW